MSLPLQGQDDRRDEQTQKIVDQTTKNQLLRERLQRIQQRRYHIQKTLYKTASGTGFQQKEKVDDENDRNDVRVDDDDETIITNGLHDDHHYTIGGGGGGDGVTLVEELLDSLCRERQEALRSYQSILSRRRDTAKFLNLAQQWNVTNDCFHIWHQGPFGTINGLRLGLSEAAATVVGASPTATATPLLMSSTPATSTTTSNSTPGSSYFSFSTSGGSVLVDNDEDDNNDPDNSYHSTTMVGGGWYAAATAPAPHALSASSRGVVGGGGYWSSMSPFSSSIFTSDVTTTATSSSSSASTMTTSINGSNPNVNNNTNGGSMAPPPPVALKIPWIEINSALGHVALLLSSLAAKHQPPTGNNFFFPHEIFPMGSSSKIGILRRVEPPPPRRSLFAMTSSAPVAPVDTTTAPVTTTELVTVYNLSYSDESFSLFGKRNFNTALQCLLQCLQTAAETTIQRRDRTMALPHAIYRLKSTNPASTTTTNNTSTSGGELGIGGLSISYGVADPVEWTRAMKYMLTDIKWLVAYAAKHSDR